MIVLAGSLLGAILGSFLATLILRWPEGRGLGGRSRCDECGRVLRVRELVPLVSAAVARGRCRTCGGAIDPLHWQIELAAAVVGAAALAVDPGFGGMALAVLGWVLIPLAWLDWRHHWLPDRLTLPVAIGGLAVGGFATGVSLSDRVIGGVAGFAVLWAIGAAYRRLRGRQGLGGGDPKLLGALGCWVGWAALPTLLLVAAGSSLALIYASGRARDPGRRYPFGTALCAAGAIVALALNMFSRLGA